MHAHTRTNTLSAVYEEAKGEVSESALNLCKMNIGFVDYSRTGYRIIKSSSERAYVCIATTLEVIFLSCHRVLVPRIEFLPKRVNVR